MATPTHKYTILSMMKDEGHSLVEWVAYHKHIGFDNICVYTNNCGDGTDEMLIRLDEMGLVKHFPNEVPEGKKPQPNALGLATKNPDVMDSEWILVMDADEFLSVKVGRGLVSDLVDEIPAEASAVAITWRFFGSNGVTDFNPGMVIDAYPRAAPDMFKKGWGVKTLFKPYHDIKLGIHRPHIKKAKHDPANAKILFDQLWVNGSGVPMPDEFSLSGWRSTKPTVGYELAEMNHYAVKSYEAYLLRRLRGNVNNKEDKYNAAYFALFDRNEEEANNAQRHSNAVRRQMDKILDDPEMRRLQDKAMDFHAARVEQLRNTGEYDTWLKDLKEASEVSIDRLDEVLFTQHLPKEWQIKVKEMQAAGVSDKVIAKMISNTQTAKKGETRAALLAAAGETPVVASNKADKNDKVGSLSNPFEKTDAAKSLGVPQIKLSAEQLNVIREAKQAAEKTRDAAKQSAPAPAKPEVKVEEDKLPKKPKPDQETRAKWRAARIAKAAAIKAAATPFVWAVKKPALSTPPVAVKKATVKKAVVKKVAAKKPAAKKATTRKTTAKKPVAAKTTPPKTTAKKPTTRKPAVKKPTTKKPAAKTPAAKAKPKTTPAKSRATATKES